MADSFDFIYGTAWKEEATTNLVIDAVQAGFKAIDTANQAKHYNEPGVGAALAKLSAQGINRKDLWLQTKFTSLNGQDHRLPYEKTASYRDQVKQSFASSLEHLGTDYLDSYVLHGPYSAVGLTDADWEVWGAIEEIYKSGKSKRIGISNVTPDQLQQLIDGAKIKPSVVQNRCYASRLWDKKTRQICLEHDIMYQGFSLLTANLPFLQNRDLRKIAAKHEVSAVQVVFKFAMQIGMTPLTGTTSKDHMTHDLHCGRFELNVEELETIEQLALHPA